MQLSVVIACYNAARTIGGQLESLARQEWSEPWEVIVADNGSTDGSAAIAEQYRSRLPSLRVVDASARRGQAYARNVGAKAARGVALAFVTPTMRSRGGGLPRWARRLSATSLWPAAWISTS